MAKLLVCGSRSITDSAWIFSQIEQYISEKNLEMSSLVIIEGGAKGVDSVAGNWAQSHGVTVEVHNADWARYDRGAGIRRNEEMVAAADFVLVLWDGSSRGTKNDIDLCRKNFKTYKVVKKLS